jgi:recombination protein RecT
MSTNEQKTTSAPTDAAQQAATAAVQQAKRPAPVLRQMLESDDFRSQIARALPAHCKPERFIRIAITAMTKTPGLASCDKGSFFLQLLRLSELGIEPDGRRAHLIPFENRRAGIVECQLIIDYKGLAELIMRSGLVSNLHADVVCESDDFHYDCGQVVRHVIDFQKPRGAMYAAYAICRLKDGSAKCDVMSKAEVDAIRARSRSGGSGPWQTDYTEMAKKTVFRRLSKWLPLSPEVRDAVEVDDDALDVPSKVIGDGGAGSALVAELAAQASAPASAPEVLPL